MIRVETDAFDAVLAFWRPALASEGGRCVLASSERLRTDLEHAVVALRCDEPAKLHRFESGSYLYASVAPSSEPIEGLVRRERLDAVDGTGTSFVLEDPVRNVVYLPFSPDEAIRGFLDEGYVAPTSAARSSALTAYYAVKRFVPRQIMMAARSAVARRQARALSFPRWPIEPSLDDLQRLILRAILQASGADAIPFVWFWPEGKHAALILTHDVETATGRDAVPAFIDAEQSLGFVSSFNVVPHKYEVSPSLLEEIQSRGHEVGVHGWDHQGSIVATRELFDDRAARINEVAGSWNAVGFRSPSTYRNSDWFQDLAFDYDSSFPDTDPFEPQSGGCMSVFPYHMGRLVELPITMPQDHTLFTLLGEKDARLWRAKASAIGARHGLICMLTHPDTDDGYTGSGRVFPHYVEMLRELGDDTDLWHALPRDVARWWRSRTLTSVDPTGRILEGPASETAMIARASIANGELVLEVDSR